MAFRRPENMEMACTRPGVWRVEGYDVERVRADGKVWWQVFERHGVRARENEPYALVETFHGKRRSLAEACGLVWDLITTA